MKVFLSDTTIRQYRRRDQRVSFRLRGYLMIETTTTFRLHAYLRDISAALTLSDGTVVSLDDIGISYDCLYRSGVMMHTLWAAGIAERDIIRDDVGRLRIDYHLSFTGHSAETPDVLELHVPVVGRGRNWVSKRLPAVQS